MSASFATIGHSNRPPETVIDMLREAEIRLLIDVRSFPKSRTNPDFNDDRFPDVLAGYQIGYRHMLALGGRRPKQAGVDESLNRPLKKDFEEHFPSASSIRRIPSTFPQFDESARKICPFGHKRSDSRLFQRPANAFWRVRSFHNYADYALGRDFQQAFGELVGLGRDHSLALMCSEAVWWRCHRRIITDYLLLNDHEVRHLMAPGRIDMAEPTEAACLREDGAVIYPQSDEESSPDSK